VPTRLEFHTGIGDPLGYSCRLLRKAYRRGLRAVVCGEAERLSRLDTLLWTFEQLEFVPHARLRAGERPDATMQRTPIWLADRGADWPACDLVVNLGDEPVDGAERLARVIEIVGDGDADRQAGRARWRHYAAAGLKPELATTSAAATAADDNAGQS
jgi:DNA polymerase III subunit chi